MGLQTCLETGQMPTKQSGSPRLLLLPTTIDVTEEIVTTQGEEVCVSVQWDTSRLSPCNHEEAETRMIPHVADAIQEGYMKILLRRVDTDEVTLAAETAAKLSTISDLELWVVFGTGKHFRYIPVHEIVACLGPERSQALPLFHAYTGCDTVSAFVGREKRRPGMCAGGMVVSLQCSWDCLQAQNVSHEDVAVLERFIILLYDRTSSLTDINEARLESFMKKV